MEGYIKLYRKLLESSVFQNEKALKVFIWCLLKATHKDREQLVGQQLIKLESGQFIFGRKKASEELKMKESTIYKYIKLLEEMKICNIKSNNKFSIVSIEKWSLYQVQEEKNNSNNNNKVTTKEQQSNTNKNVKNIYINLINKYKEQPKTFYDKMKFYRKIKNDDIVKSLSPNDEYKLKDLILGGNY